MMTRKLGQAGGTAHAWYSRAWLSLTLVLLLVGPARAQNFDSELASAAGAIAGAIEQAGKQRVAVIDFDQIEGQVTALGRFLAEEISANLAERPRAFAVIDRASLQSILSEHALSMSGLVNPENAKRLGQIAGVDALVLGTYTDFEETYRLSLRAIATDSAQLVASARTNLPKTNALVQLAGRVVDQPELPGTTPPDGAEPPVPPPAPTPEVLYETGVGKGGFEGWLLSPDWKRLNGMLVNDGTGKRIRGWGFAVPILASYNPRSADYAVEAEIRVTQEGGYRDSFGVVVRANDQGGYAAAVGQLERPVARICYLTAYWGIGDRDDCKPLGQAARSDGDWHTYRVEVKGNTIILLIDNFAVTSGTDNRFLSAGRVGLWSNKHQLEVRNFKVFNIEQHTAAPLLDTTERAANLAGSSSGRVVEVSSEASLTTQTPSSGDGMEAQLAALPPRVGGYGRRVCHR